MVALWAVRAAVTCGSKDCMVQAILFDLGETLVNFGVGRAEAEGVFRQGARDTYNYLRTAGFELPDFQRYFKTHYRLMQRRYIWSKISGRDFSYMEVVRDAGRKLGLKLDIVTQRELAWHWYGPVRRGATFEHGLHCLIERLALSGVKLGIVSNTLVPGFCFDRHLQQLGLLQYFPVRVYSSDVRYRKPHARIFEIAAERIAVDPVFTVFVGDLIKTDIVGAKAMGMKTIWKTSATTRVVPTANARPDDMIYQLSQLPDVLPRFGWRSGLHVPVVEPVAAVA